MNKLSKAVFPKGIQIPSRTPTYLLATLFSTVLVLGVNLNIGAVAISTGGVSPAVVKKTEVGIPLSSILKTDGASANLHEDRGHNGFNIMQWAFNTLFVLGLGILVMKQPWFTAWAQRVRELHQVQQVPVGLACLKAILFQSERSEPFTPTMKPPFQEAVLPTSVAYNDAWCQCLQTITLPTGTHLHVMLIQGRYYILTETASHSHWLACENNQNPVAEPAPLTTEVLQPDHEQVDVFHSVPQPTRIIQDASAFSHEGVTQEVTEATTMPDPATPVTMPQGISLPVKPRLVQTPPAPLNDVMDAQTFFARHST